MYCISFNASLLFSKFQLLAEDLGPLLKEKEKSLGDHEHLKVKLESEYEEQDQLVKSYAWEFGKLQEKNVKIKEYVIWTYIVWYRCISLICGFDH